MFPWLLLLFILLAFIGVALLVATVYIAYVHRQYRHLPGPPYHSFFFGHLPVIQKINNRGDFIGHLFLQWAEEYGPILKIFILHKAIVLISSASVVKEVLTKSKYVKSPLTYKNMQSLCGKRFLGTGLLSETDHYKWHKRRSVINSAFHRKYLRLFMKQFNDVADRWIEALTAVADGQTVFSMHEYLGRTTLDAIAEVGFNHRMDAIKSTENEYLVAVQNCLKAASKSMKDPLFAYRAGEGELRKAARQSVTFLRSHGERILRGRIGLMKSGKEVPEDILAFIIKCKDADPSLNVEVLLDDFMTLFLAGQETTASALAFLFCEVGKDPDILQGLQEEVESVMGSRTYVEYEDVIKLEYCGQVFKETLRMYPPGQGTTRDNVDEVTINGFRIPAGSMIAVSFFAIHHLQQYHDNPWAFCPERFSADTQRPLFTYMPFSIGQRSCIGQQFAGIEAKVLMCKFFQKFNFKLDPDQSFDILEIASHLRPKGGTMMSLSVRSE